MSDLIKRLAAHPTVAAAYERDEKSFFGQGWSHFPKAFRAEVGPEKVSVYLSVYNTPHHTQVNWSLSDPGVYPGYPQWPWRECWTRFELTADESLAFAAFLGLSIEQWLAEALEACRTDVTPGAVAEGRIRVCDLDAFHMMRSAGIEEAE